MLPTFKGKNMLPTFKGKNMLPTFKGKNMLPMESIFLPFKVAPLFPSLPYISACYMPGENKAILMLLWCNI